MADERLPPERGVGESPPSRHHDVLLVEIAKIQSDGEHLKQYMADVRGDMKDARDRLARIEVRVENCATKEQMARIEERVAHLPSKGYIAAIVSTGLGLLVAFLTFAPLLQKVLGIVK